MGLEDRYKRIIVQPATAQLVRLDAKPELATLLEDTLAIFQTEILKYKRRSNENVSGTLSPTDARTLQGYAKTLVDMAKEVRAREKDDEGDLEGMSQEELLAQTEAAATALRAKIKEGK